MKRILFLILFAAAFYPVTGQDTLRQVMQVTGVVISGDSLYGAPYVTVYRESDFRGTFSDDNGYFTIPALEGDTLWFMGLGFKKTMYKVPESSGGQRLQVVQYLETDTVELKTVYVLPWPAPQDLRKEILAMDMSDDRVLTIQKGIRQMWEHNDLIYVGPSGAHFNEVLSDIRNRQQNTGYVQNQLLNPFAWASFFKAIRDGEFNGDD
jgi:hypothetical protein